MATQTPSSPPSPPSRRPTRVLVVGAGGIGGVLMGYLLAEGHRLECVAHREAIAEGLREKGVVLRERSGERRLSGELVVHVAPPEQGAFDFILLATPPSGAEAAARATRHLLAPPSVHEPGGAMVCFQNGLIEERVARVVPRMDVFGAVVAWGASSPAPGVYERTSTGGFILGNATGELDVRLPSLASLLEGIGPVRVTDNLAGARWSKLAVNCAVSSLGTIGGDRLGALLSHRFARRLALEVMTEVVEVAQASGVRLEPVIGGLNLERLALGPKHRRSRGSVALLFRHLVMLAIGTRYRRLRSSMLAAIERGREPPVAFLNGEVVAYARAKGRQAPLNARIVALVGEIARGEKRSSLRTLEQLYVETRPLAL